jgi:large subunit ribosomal protein L11
LEKGSGNPGTEYVGNLTMDQVISIAKKRQTSTYAKTIKSSVKEVLGTCQSMGITIEDKIAKDIAKEVREGKFDTRFQ